MTTALTRPQSRMWFLQQLDPGRVDLNLVNGFRLSGVFDQARWNQAVTNVVSRHEILRSRFVQVADNPAHRSIETPISFEIQSHELEGSNPTEREQRWQALAPALAREPFDLAHPPLVRIHVALLAPNQHALLLVMHHIISDGDASAQALMTELARELEGVAGADSVAAINHDSAHHDDLGFWRDYLDDAPQRIDLTSRIIEPTANQRAETTPQRQTAVPISLPSDLVAKLIALAHQQGVSLFDCLLAAYGILLRSHSGQDSVLIGWPEPNRPTGQRDIGYWGQPLAIRFDVREPASFRDVIDQTSTSFQAALAHKHADFALIVQELAADLSSERDARFPLFQVMFDFRAAIKRINAPGIQIEPAWWDPGFTTYEWSLFLYQEDDSRVEGRLEFQPSRHDPDLMQAVARRYELLLTAMASEPQALAHTPLTREDHQTLQTAGTGPPIELPRHTTPDWFETQASLTPNAVALEFKGQSLSYRELNEQANQLARALQHAGLQAGQIIGSSIERSVISMVTLLAIWKAGGVFLPLDPAYPNERLKFLLEDCQATLLITTTSDIHRIEAPAQCRTLLIDDLLRDAQTRSGNNLEIGIDHDMLSNIIYTSGSTGIPKGVAMVHRCLVNLVAWQLDASSMRQGLRALQFASLNFDVSYQEIMSTWCAGGTLVLIDESTRKDPSALLKYLIEHRINRLFLPFVALQQLGLATQNKPVDGLHLREVLTAGEQLRSTPALRELFNRLPNCRLLNQYGPSEAHVITSLTLPESPDDWDDLPAIGYPLANTNIVVVDSALNLTPPGAPGELLVSGAGLAQGYVNREQLTKASFIEHRFFGTAMHRWYRTGDLVRWLADGSLQFISRLDKQHKVRGFRVDLGEIEAALGEHDDVLESVVTVRGEADTAQLLAYVVPRHDNVKQTELEAHRIEDWSTLWESTYQDGIDSDFNLAGWTSSYNEQAIDAEQMRQWRDTTVDRIMALRPKRVLEIGCGAGLLLSEIAPACELYAASDFSHTVVKQLSERINRNPELKRKVKLCQGEALNPGDWPAGQFDTIILNSVLQLFPSADYLTRVLANAIKLLAPGGRVFVGDVQNFDLIEAYHAGVAAYRHQDGVWSQARESWARNVALEDQLLVSPDFFKALPTHLDAIKQVKINLKSGQYLNELSKFRYDVVLETKSSSSTPTHFKRIPYEGPVSLEAAREAFQTTGLAVVLARVPNARLQADLHALNCLLDESLTQEPIAKHMSEALESGMDPQTFWDMAASIGAHCAVSWSDSADCMDVCWSQDADFYPSHDDAHTDRPLTNDPTRVLRHKSLINDIASDLARKLPAYMLPHHIMVLESLPVKTNGKVDISKLPAPTRIATGPRTRSLTEAQAQLAGIWEQTLGLRGIAAEDDFFALGGHSLLAVELLYRIRQQLGVELSLSELFEARTVERLCQTIEQRHTSASDHLEEGVL